MAFSRISNLLKRIPGVDSATLDKSLPEWLVAIVTFPFRFIFQFVAFLVTYWAASRPLPAFVRGLPAILVAGGFVSAIIAASFLLETRRVGQYEGRYMLEMTKNDNPVMAAEYAQKLMGLLPTEDRYRYYLGLAQFQAGDLVKAIDVMRYIAVEKDSPLAQVWLARTISSDETIDLSDEEKNKQSIAYFDSAIKNLDPEENIQEFIDAHLGLAVAYERESVVAPTEAARQISLNKAIDQLKVITGIPIVTGGQLQAIPVLIRLYQETGQTEKAKEQLRVSMSDASKLARRLPDNLDIWAVMVSSCALVNDFDYANTIIQEGLKLAPTPLARQRILRLQSRVLLKKAEEIKDLSTERNYKICLAAVSQAVAADPISPAGFESLVDFVIMEDESEEQKLWLRQSVIGSRTPDVTHVVLGMRALDRGEILEGQRHWQIASQQSARTYLLINSLISFCHAKMPERFENLNDIVSVAIESFPSQFVFYLTRGRMYLADEKYQQAVDDLEIAARKLPKEILLRESLAEAYAGLGNTAKSEENQAEADRMRAEREAKSQELLEKKN